MIIAPTSHTESSANQLREASVATRDVARDVEKKANFERQVERRQRMDATLQRNREAKIQRSRDAFEKSMKQSMERDPVHESSQHMVRAVIRRRADEARMMDRTDIQQADAQQARQREQDVQMERRAAETREQKANQDAQAVAVRRKVEAVYSEQADNRQESIRQREFEEVSAREKQRAANAYRDDNNRSAIDRTLELVV